MKLSENQKNIIVKTTNLSDFKKGLTYPINHITNIIKRKNRFAENEYIFRILSSVSRNYYFVKIVTDEDEIMYADCSCPQFEQTDSCKHIAACLIQNASELLKEKTTEDLHQLSLAFFNDYLKEIPQNNIKEEVHLEFKFTIKENYWDIDLVLNLRIGTKKMYSLNNRLRAFIIAYTQGEKYKFGKEFEYNPKAHFFDQKSQNILKFVAHNLHNCYYDGIHLDEDEVKEIMPNLIDKMIYFNDKKITEWKEESPYAIRLQKENDLYEFTIDQDQQDIIKLTSDLEYSIYQNKIYHTDREICDLITKMQEQKLKKLIFKETDLPMFSKTILPLVKENITLDESVSDLIIVSTPKVQIYFDMKLNLIEAKVIFIYKNQEVEYFDTKNNHILRDQKFEMEVINDLIESHFQITNKNIYMEEIDDIGIFLDEKLEILSSKYEIFTSQKIQNIKIRKNNHVSSSFSIGEDNVLHYAFDLDQIKEDELEELLKSLKRKKKYFKLKSGDICSLEDQNLQEFQELVDELDIDYETLLHNKGELPKYYALYIDSLKKRKFNSIQTNNLFNDFIEKFQKYQNALVTFTDEELQILRDYQVAGVKWLYTIHKCGFGGILADEMGLGKSLQTITLFQKILKEEKDSKYLIIAPTSLIYNWKNEFTKFAPNIEIEILADNKQNRKDKLTRFDKTVYITTYGLLREDLELYQDKKFEICVIDEAQNIKNPKAGLSKATKKINANTKLALTGTPIENNITELWSIFDYIMPGFLSSLVKFQDKYKISEYNEESENLLSKLKEQIKPFILRRKKIEVAKDLPEKIENTIYLDLSEKEKKIYAAEVKRAKEKMEEKIAKEGFSKSKIEILSLITRLRQLCISPKIIYEEIEETSSKIENLMQVLKEVIANGHKVLLFSNFRNALELVKEELKKENIKNYTIDGSVPSKRRMQFVEQFNKDNTPVFLIMLKSGGTGLNLTSADIVIHLDLWWNPQSENQATDRTHRIGQTKTVEVIKLIAKGTIEERILELQKKKQQLSDKLIENNNTDETILSRLTEQDIRNLLSFENDDK